jgi:hypothetical protein
MSAASRRENPAAMRAENEVDCNGKHWIAPISDLFGSFIGISILAGLSLVLCIGGLTLLLSDEKH